MAGLPTMSHIDSANQEVRYSGKLSRKKTFTNFTILEPPAKIFPRNLGVPYPPMIGFSIPPKFFSVKWFFLPKCESFLPWKFLAIWYAHSCYICATVLIIMLRLRYAKFYLAATVSTHFLPLAPSSLMQIFNTDKILQINTNAINPRYLIMHAYRSEEIGYIHVRTKSGRVAPYKTLYKT